jgi:hypothetical protein
MNLAGAHEKLNERKWIGDKVLIGGGGKHALSTIIA